MVASDEPAEMKIDGLQEEPTPRPQVTKRAALGMQVCVPKGWTDEQVVEFANRENPSGTTAGWAIRREGDSALAGDPERVDCRGRDGFVHIMLDP